MLDAFFVLTRGGFVLFSFQMGPLTGDPLGALIRECLLEERAGEDAFSYSRDGVSYTLKWVFDNEARLVFVAAHQRVLSLTYVEGLLAKVKASFVGSRFHKEVGSGSAFEPEFRRLLAAAEAQAAAEKRARAAPVFSGSKSKPAAVESPSASAVAAAASEPQQSAAEASTPGGLSAFDVSKLARKKAGAGSAGGPASASKPSSSSKKGAPGSTGKAKRVWGDAGGDSEGAQLDFSSPPPSSGREDSGGAEASGGGGAALQLGRSAMDEEDEEVEDDDETEETVSASSSGKEGGKPGKPKGWFAAALRSPAATSLLGKSSLAAEDVSPILEALKVNLLKKNVASEIADKLCESVSAGLEGKRLASFTSLGGTVRTAMEAALTRILTPTRSVDILRDVDASREARAAAGGADGSRPYVIVFVGVNGVGKSTNLAKIAYWLTSNGKKVMIAACDTFRSGAVEQLRTHCSRLQVPLFERGYAKDPAGVAAEGVKAAAKAGCDVLLVDTAGRMQDNEPLMRALAKLINVNRPDLTLFVGEALVGNDAVDQLSKFNSRLADLAEERSTTRLIDGIVLTKFDTIDDKVGAALSMVYTSGAPVMFVGTGQTYTDLKRFNPRSVVNSLLR